SETSDRMNMRPVDRHSPHEDAAEPFVSRGLNVLDLGAAEDLTSPATADDLGDFGTGDDLAKRDDLAVRAQTKTRGPQRDRGSVGSGGEATLFTETFNPARRLCSSTWEPIRNAIEVPTGLESS